MKRFTFLYALILLLSSSLVFNYEIDPSSYSLLIPLVRKDVISDILKSLPNKKYTNILQMSNSMAKAKEEYSLNDAEAAYLVYAWMGKILYRDCNTENTDYEFPTNVYNKEKGNFIGFAALFYTLASNLNVQVVPVQGKQKITSKNSDIYTVIDTAWNSILIDNTYYLVDSATGAGYCDNDDFIRRNTDFYFGTKPEIFIKTHIPDDSSWQLLDKTVTLSTFNSWPYISHRFYLYGMQTFSPSQNNLDVSKGSKVTITYDKEITNLSTALKFITNGKYQKYDNFKGSNGKIEIVFDGKFTTADHLIIYASQESSPTDYYTVLIYTIK